MIDYKFLIFLLPYCFCDDLKGKYEYLTASSPDESQIERPCGAVYDVNCVRDFLYEHSKCKKTYGPVPDPYYRNVMIFDLPSLNLTVSNFNVRISGLNGRIDEFYINRHTDRVVITVEFINFSMNSDRGLFRFQRRAKEPVVTEAPAFVNYTSILTTVVIPHINDLDLEHAEITTFANDFVPAFGVGPTILSGVRDPQVIRTVAQFPTRPALNVQEIFLVDSAFYVLTFLQHNICDFGVKTV